MSRRKHPTGAGAFDTLTPAEAVLAAWAQPADTEDDDILTRERIRTASPQLGRALDRLSIEHDNPTRKDHTK